MKRILCLFLTIFVLFSLAPVAAAYDADAVCSIEVLVQYDGEKIDGGKLKAVKVGYVDIVKGEFRRLTDDKIIEDIGKKSAVNAMVAYYSDNKKVMEPVTVKVSKGKAVFTDLSVGLYLIFQEDAASGYNNLAPFLVTLPYTDEDNELIYDVTVSSKTELLREPNKPNPPSRPSGGKLPQTGQLTWPVPVLAASGMVLFLFGWWLCFGRRKDSYET